MKIYRSIAFLAAAVLLTGFAGSGVISARAEYLVYSGGITSKSGPGAGSLSEAQAEAPESTAQPGVITIGEMPAADGPQADLPAETSAAQAEAFLSAENGAVSVQTQDTAAGEAVAKNGYHNGARIGLNSAWQFADHSAIHTGEAVMYTASSGRKDRIVAVNAGHGTAGGESVKTLCHPDGTKKVTGGSTAAGAVKATAVSSGMVFQDGTRESAVTLRMARILRDRLLAEGYDVLMIRDGDDVQLDNIARTVISNNTADIHIALHWDGDGLSYDKGAFYMSVPDALKSMEPVKSCWQQHEALGNALISGLQTQGIKIWGSNPLDMDLTQTSYSTIPSVDIELGNQCSDHSDARLAAEAEGLVRGIGVFFGF